MRKCRLVRKLFAYLVRSNIDALLVIFLKAKVKFTSIFFVLVFSASRKFCALTKSENPSRRETESLLLECQRLKLSLTHLPLLQLCTFHSHFKMSIISITFRRQYTKTIKLYFKLWIFRCLSLPACKCQQIVS